MNQHPAVLQTLIRQRVAELCQSAEATAHVRREKRWHRLVAATRRGTGWMLVDVGLRLAVPRGATNHRVAGGQ